MSSGVAGVSSIDLSPIAAKRTAQCPTMPPTFTPFGRFATSSKYSPYEDQFHESPLRMLSAGMSSTDSIISASTVAPPFETGANVTPQFPKTTEVTPCQHDELAIGSHASWASKCVCISTNPGVTI